MNTNKRKFTGRIALITIAILLLLTTLTGCFGGNKGYTKTAPVVRDIFVASTETEEGRLTMNDLKAIATMLASAWSADYDPQERLIAAKRGYNMTVLNFDLAADRPDLGTPDFEAAVDVIVEANEKAPAANKLSADVLGKLYTWNEAGEQVSNLNASELNLLVASLQSTVDVTSQGGFFDKILTVIGSLLNVLTRIGFGSYLVGICIFAILIEICMLPFDIKQQKNTIRQAQLRPKEMAIRNKYKGRTDQPTLQKMQQEIQDFYQKENFSPYSGCLPLLIQLPIIMALWNIVMDPLRYVLGRAAGLSQALTTYYTTAKAAGGMGASIGSGSANTITLLAEIRERGISVLDGLKNFDFFTNSESVFNSMNEVANNIPNFSIGNINFALNPDIANFNILLLVPVLTFVSYFVTSKLNRKFMAQPVSNGGVEDKQVACSNNMMDITMPMMSTFFTFMVPALVGIYWIFRSLIGLLKRFIMSKLMPLPVFTEEDYKAAAKEMAGKRVVEKSDRVGRVRSLHHIDDEDFEDTRERGLARRAALEEDAKKDQEAKQKKTPFEAPSMKETRKEEKKAAPEQKTEENHEGKEVPAPEQTDGDNTENTENK